MLHKMLRIWLVGSLLFLLFNPISITMQISRSDCVDLQPGTVDGHPEGWKHPKLESVLTEVLEIYHSGDDEQAALFASRQNLEVENGSVRVVLESSVRGIFEDVAPASAHWLASMVKVLGGEVECVNFTRLQCLIPMSALRDIADMDAVRSVRIPHKALPQVTTEGVSISHADLWQNLPSYWGAEIRVGILDCGFKGVDALIGTELPSDLLVRSFRSDGARYDEAAALDRSAHGTACAEIVHDMSPGSSLALAAFETETEFASAVDWLLDTGVSIILCPVGFLPDISAGDGSGPICQVVDKAHTEGVLWVSSAGNAAQWSWTGGFSDKDGDRWHNFLASDETNTIQGTEGTILTACLTWDDWGTWDGAGYGGSDQDFDLYLFRESPFTILAKSENAQSGSQNPSEVIRIMPPYTGKYHLAVRKRSASGLSSLRLCVVENTSLQFQDPGGSLLIPADSAHAISVGATLWGDDSYAVYSSRGPTADGRLKPDLTAPTGVSCSVFGPNGFNGSSASAAHVAGALALMKSKTPFGLGSLLSFLEFRAVDLGSPGQDNLFGYGRLNLTP